MKNTRKKRQNGKIIIGIAFIAATSTTIGIMSNIVINHQQKEESYQASSVDTLKLYYRDTNGMEYAIKEGQTLKSVPIYMKDGEVRFFEKNGDKIKFDNNMALEEGEYTITLVSEDKKTQTINFVIDTTPPKLLDINNKDVSWFEPMTITFEDIDDVKIAKLKDLYSKEEIDLLNKEEEKYKYLKKNDEGKYIYVIEKSSDYTLDISDEVGNNLQYELSVYLFD